MADLITIDQNDSTSSGVGETTQVIFKQLPNAANDAIILIATKSLNNGGQVASINATTPAGYTLLTNLRDNEVRSWVYYKQSTGAETIPTITTDKSSKFSCATVIVTDVDWANGGVAQQVQNTANGNQQSPDLTTQSAGNASAIICFQALERRSSNKLRYPESRAQTKFVSFANTGADEGVDNCTSIAYDFTYDRNTLWDGPYWEANGAGDSLAINIEVVTQGNIAPLQLKNYVNQGAPSSTFQTTMDWCRKIVNSGKHIDGSTLQNWSFTPSDVDTSNNQITLTGHGMDESMIVRLSDGGGTAPGGLADDTFYYVEPVSADKIQLRVVNEDSDAAGDFYANGTSKRTLVSISSTGTGTFTFTESRMLNAGTGILDLTRPNSGNSSNAGAFSGNYIGDAGYNQNDIGTSQRFNSTLDLTGYIIGFEFLTNTGNRIDRVNATLIDDNDNWISWRIFDGNINPSGETHTYRLQVENSNVRAKAFSSFGTFDFTAVRYLVVSARGNNKSTARYNAINSPGVDGIRLFGAITLINGNNSSVSDLLDLANSYGTIVQQNAEGQLSSLASIEFGDGNSDISFVDSLQSIAFPRFADNVTKFQSYISEVAIKINATANSAVKITNSQLRGAEPFDLEVVSHPSSTVDLSGNSYVFATASLDADLSYNRQLFVGGNGIDDNNGEIRNSTLIVNDQVGANNALINWFATTDVEDTTFELIAGATVGHAIKITVAGTYTFNNLSFSGFGADGTNTAAIFNDSGGVVTITSDGGTTPTVRNGAGASTVTKDPDQPISITNIEAGSRMRIYNVTTGVETVNTVVSGTSYTSSYQEGTDYTDGDVVRVYLTKRGKDEWVGDVIDTSNGFNVLASQVDNDVYAALGIDGTTVTKFQADYVNNEVDLVIGSDWTMAELYAWWANNLTTEDGIRNFFGGITAIDEANFRINTAIVDLYLDNTTNASYKQTDNRRFFRDTGTGYPVRNPTTSGYGLDVVWRNTILIAQTEAGGTSDLNFYDIKRAVKQVITNPKYIKGQK